MYLDAILEVVIGLVFTWLVLSIASMQVQEWISSRFNWRGQFLEDSIKNMLQGEKLVNEFFNHPMIASLSSPGRKPSYIPSNRFAQIVNEVYSKKSDEEKNILIFGEPNEENKGLKLEDVYGIGPDSAKRLIDDGISTVEQLAEIDAKSLRGIIHPKYEHIANEEKIIEHASKLMKSGNKRLEDVNGIGPDSARRLTEAGISTVEQLAKISADRLREIIHPNYEHLADEEEIIKHAKTLIDRQKINK